MNKSASAKTSIVQIPSIFKQLKDKLDCNENVILNYGCGRKESQLLLDEYYNESLILHYDPYHNSISENQNSMYKAHKYADYVVCANVLNVIMSDEELLSAVDRMLLVGTKEVYIQIYEGNKSGIFTKTQRNMKTRDYLPFIEEIAIDNGYSYKVSVKSNIIKLEIER